MKRVIITISIILLLICLTNPTITVEQNVVTGIVTKTDHIPATFVQIAPMPLIMKERFLVTISYQNTNEVFDDKNLFDSVTEGDKIPIILREYYIKSILLERELLLQ